MFLGLLILMLAQSLLISRLFIKFLVEWVTLALFALSCLTFIVQCLLSQNKCSYKLLISLFFSAIAVGGILLLMDALQTVPNFINPSMWSNKILPITLIISLFSAIIITIEPFFKIYFGKTINALGNTDAVSDYSNSEIKEPIHPQQDSYIDDQDLETEIDIANSS